MNFRKTFSKKSFFLLMSLLVLNSFFVISENLQAADNYPSSIILLIGDGMGLEHIKFGELVEYGIENSSSIFSFPYNTTIITDNLYNQTTDSAAAGTAISTGVKTVNGRIATTWDAKNLTTILEIAELNGYSTGLVATCHLTHATPASFAAHERDRNDYKKIAEDFTESDVDIFLGGGYGERYLGDYLQDFLDLGYNYITKRSELDTLTDLQILGLFAESSLPSYQEMTEESSFPLLSEMTSKAIDLLNATEEPFFLMIEGSQIDWAGHDNDPIYLAHQIIEFEKTVKLVKELGEQNSDWQIIVTSDHETGGLTIEDYSFTTAIPQSTDSLALQIAKRTNRSQEINVNWDSTGHTKTKVILAGMGPFTEDILSATHHIDTFSIMRQAIDGKTSPIGTGFYEGFIPVPIYGWVLIGFAGLSVISITFVVIRKIRKRSILSTT